MSNKKICLVIWACLLWIFFICLWNAISHRATRADLEEIWRTVASLRLSKEEEKKELKAVMETIKESRRFLIVGLVETLEEFFGTDNHGNISLSSKAILAVGDLCWAFHESNSQSTVDVHVLYKSKNDPNVESNLLQFLKGHICQPTLQSENELWTQKEGTNKDQFLAQFKEFSRYKRLAMLRSEQRRQILDANHDGYDVVVSVDMDVVSLPPIVPLVNAMEVVATDRAHGIGSIVCSNGIENVNVFNGWLQLSLYYDTFATILEDGTWGFTGLTQNPMEQIKHGQTLLLRDILRKLEGPTKYDQRYHMQSCFGGAALYDFDTWATPVCDYYHSRIELMVEHTDDNSASGFSFLHAPNDKLHQLKHFNQKVTRWKLDPKYQSPDGWCEHMIFQQCLYAANREKSTMKNKRQLNIGIQPDLVIERQAAVMSRWEDWRNVPIVCMRKLAGPGGFTLVIYCLFRYLLFPKNSKSPRIKRLSETKVGYHD